MWDGFNKRKFPRINLHCEISIHSESEALPITAKTENLGIGGVCVMIDRSIERFSKCKIKLDLGGKPVECDARVVWAVPTREGKSSRKRYDIGFEFLNLPPQQMQAVRDYLEQEIKKSPELAPL